MVCRSDEGRDRSNGLYIPLSPADFISELCPSDAFLDVTLPLGDLPTKVGAKEMAPNPTPPLPTQDIDEMRGFPKPCCVCMYLLRIDSRPPCL